MLMVLYNTISAKLIFRVFLYFIPKPVRII